MEKQNRSDIGGKAGLVGIIVNVLLAGGKLFAGILTASVSIISDALNNFTDSLTSVISFIGFKLSQKPADDEHPYGHARFEYVSSLIIAVVVLFIGFELARNSVEKIITPEAINFSLVAIIILAVSILGKAGLFVFNSVLAKKIDSATLKATAVDCRNDVIMTAVVLASTLVERFTGWKVDGYTGLLVAIFIFISGISLIKETVSPILGEHNDEKIKELLEEKIKEYPIIEGFHDLMIHDYGPGTSFCSVHLEIDKNVDTLVAHEQIDKFERDFSQYGTTLTVHYDPIVCDSPQLNKMKEIIVSTIKQFDERLSIHDLRFTPCDGFLNLFFDMPLPRDLNAKKQEIEQAILHNLTTQTDDQYQLVITYDSFVFN